MAERAKPQHKAEAPSLARLSGKMAPLRLAGVDGVSFAIPTISSSTFRSSHMVKPVYVCQPFGFVGPLARSDCPSTQAGGITVLQRCGACHLSLPLSVVDRYKHIISCLSSSTKRGSPPS